MIVSIEEAIKLLKEGKCVALPTETVYGLAALYNNPKAIDAIFTLKGRPRENPLIVHVSDIKTMETLVPLIPKSFYALAEAFWPGPLSLAVDVDTDKVLDSVRAGLRTACFRMPSHPLALDVLQETGPLVMPSANLSGRPSPTDARSVEEDFGPSFPILDGGPCKKGLESTILIFKNDRWHLGRLGSIPLERIEPHLGYIPEEHKKDLKPLCPGQLLRHYAPKADLILSKTPLEDVDAILGFDERSYPPHKHFLSLGSIHTPEDAATKLYSLLRELDRLKLQKAWIDTDFPENGLWRTLRERIEKASL